MREWLHELDNKKIWWYAFCALLLLCLTFVFAVQHNQANQAEAHASSDGPRLPTITQPHNQPGHKTPQNFKDLAPTINRLQKRTPDKKTDPVFDF